MCDPRRVKIINEGLHNLASLGGPPVSQDAKILLYAIGMQEDPHLVRAQITKWGKGPARGVFQFERDGGVSGVMRHPATRYLAVTLCEQQKVPFNATAIWKELEYNDLLATGFARLLLWTDPFPIPKTQDAGWRCYMRTWRPGKPHPRTWPDNWGAANRAFGDIE